MYTYFSQIFQGSLGLLYYLCRLLVDAPILQNNMQIRLTRHAIE